MVEQQDKNFCKGTRLEGMREPFLEMLACGLFSYSEIRVLIYRLSKQGKTFYEQDIKGQPRFFQVMPILPPD